MNSITTPRIKQRPTCKALLKLSYIQASKRQREKAIIEIINFMRQNLSPELLPKTEEMLRYVAELSLQTYQHAVDHALLYGEPSEETPSGIWDGQGQFGGI